MSKAAGSGSLFCDLEDDASVRICSSSVVTVFSTAMAFLAGLVICKCGNKAIVVRITVNVTVKNMTSFLDERRGAERNKGVGIRKILSCVKICNDELRLYRRNVIKG